METVEMEGKKFNTLTVVGREKNNPKGQAVWLCRCDCGNEKKYLGIMLRSRPPKSCGCDKKARYENTGGYRAGSGRKPINLKEKIRYKIDEETGCWIWSGSKKGGNGYGRVSYEGEYIGAHRGSYIAHVGVIPEGMLVLHRCDNRLCVNPEHLFIGTQSDNIQDMLKKGRGRYQRGEK
jgi:hypothetical protein